MQLTIHLLYLLALVWACMCSWHVFIAAVAIVPLWVVYCHVCIQPEWFRSNQRCIKVGRYYRCSYWVFKSLAWAQACVNTQQITIAQAWVNTWRFHPPWCVFDLERHFTSYITPSQHLFMRLGVTNLSAGQSISQPAIQLAEQFLQHSNTLSPGIT